MSLNSQHNILCDTAADSTHNSFYTLCTTLSCLEGAWFANSFSNCEAWFLLHFICVFVHGQQTVRPFHAYLSLLFQVNSLTFFILLSHRRPVFVVSALIVGGNSFLSSMPLFLCTGMFAWMLAVRWADWLILEVTNCRCVMVSKT